MLLGPAVSGRNYEVPEEMAAEVEAALPGSSTTSRHGTPALDLRAGIARQLRTLGVTAIDIDPQVHVWRPGAVQSPQGRPDGAAGVGHMDGMTRRRQGSDERESEPKRCAALAAVRRRIDEAAAAAGRNAGEIELLPITKFFPATDVATLSRLGCRSFGESREQEAAAKSAEVAKLIGESVRWHMVGQIQRNKARSLARWAYAAHSVDSPRLVAALDRAVAAELDAGARDEPLQVYVQVSLDGDPTRGGVDARRPQLVDELCDEVAAARALSLVGLMGIPPLDADPGEAFARLAAEHQRVLRAHPRATGLSAGMSDDLEAAVKHGSTCVRVGTALLGPRPLTSPSVVTPVTSSSQTTSLPEGSPMSTLHKVKAYFGMAPMEDYDDEYYDDDDRGRGYPRRSPRRPVRRRRLQPPLRRSP